MCKLIVRAFSCIGLFLVAFSAHAQPPYSLTDLGTLGGTTTQAYGINSSGQAVGLSNIAGDSAEHAFIYSNGSMQDLGTLGGTNSEAYAINSSGQVVGRSQIVGDTAWHAFLYSNGSMQDLGTLGGTDSQAYGINSSGQVVGWSTLSGDTTEHAFLYSNGSMQDLGTLGGTDSQAYGINSSGQVVGSSNIIPTSGADHAFLYSNGSMQDIGTFPGVVFDGANAINSAGQVVGSGSLNPVQPHFLDNAYLYANGSLQDLVPGSNLSVASAINSAGEVVGFYMNGFASAFLYSNGEMVDLNTVDIANPPAALPLLHAATGINDNGWIVANGVDFQTGGIHAYLLTPLAPPSAVAGPNQTINAGQTVNLNGLGSYAPNTPSSSLEYAWSFVSVPSGSNATLSGANTATPSFLADASGTYVVQLIVTDPATGLPSAPSQVTISSTWTPPTANAGPAQSATVGNTVTLSGSGTDPNGLALSYSWSLISVPSGSTAALSSGNTPNALFVPNVAGSYTIALVISDTFGSSAPSEITISVVTGADYAQQQISNAINYVTGMPVSQIQAPGHRESFTNLLQEAIAAIQAGNTSLARQKLASALTRTDGYPLRGALDGPGPGMDWIIDPTAQGQMYTDLTNALNVLL